MWVQLLSRVWLCNRTDCSPPGSSIHGVSQTRILKGVAISFSRGSSWPRIQTYISCIGRWILYHWASKKSCLNHSKSRGYFIVPIYCCTFCKFGQMYNNISSSLWYHTEYFQCPKNPAFHLFIPSPTPTPGNINSATLSIVLPFTDCHTIEHTVCTISNWLLYLSYRHLSLIHVFSSLDSSLICVCVCMCIFMCVLSHVKLFVTPMDYSLPGSSPRNFPGKNAGAGCHFLFQRIFPSWRLNLHLLHW